MFVIRGIRQKNISGSYEDLVPFGVDGQNIDMLSGLNLEKELKLGGDHLVSIEKNSDGTVVTENYVANTSDGDLYYRVVTTIGKEDDDTVINSILYWIDKSQQDDETDEEESVIFQKRKKTTISKNATTGGTDITEFLLDTEEDQEVQP